MAKNKKTLLQLEKLLVLQDLILKQSGRWLTKNLYYATEHLPVNEELTFKVFKGCVNLLFLIKRSQLFKNKIICMLESQPKAKWTTFLDKLNSSTDLHHRPPLLFRYDRTWPIIRTKNIMWLNCMNKQRLFEK